MKASICCRSSPLNILQERGQFQQHRLPCLLMFGCLFSLSLKCCLTVPIYDNRPLSVHRNNCTVTRRAESRSLLQPVAFYQALLLLLLWLFTRRRRVMATCRLVEAGWCGLRGWWSRAREGCQMLQKLMTEKRKWQIHNFLY